MELDTPVYTVGTKVVANPLEIITVPMANTGLSITNPGPQPALLLAKIISIGEAAREQDTASEEEFVVVDFARVRKVGPKVVFELHDIYTVYDQRPNTKGWGNVTLHPDNPECKSRTGTGNKHRPIRTKQHKQKTS